MSRHLRSRYGQVYWSACTLFWQQSIDENIHVPFSYAPKLTKKHEIEHCSRSSKTINWSADSFEINHVTLMSWHMSLRYGHGILVSACPVLTAVNWPYCECYKRCGLAKTRLRHPSLPFDSLPYPTRTICRRVRTCVRTYARSIMWQPNEKRLTIFHEYVVFVVLFPSTNIFVGDIKDMKTTENKNHRERILRTRWALFCISFQSPRRKLSILTAISKPCPPFTAVCKETSKY